MSALTPDRFAEFYTAVHGKEPFPWQKRVAARVCDGNWPRAIALPTAAGKTACIDIAVFALAQSTPEQRQPRRVFFVVDRRIVVDQAFEHARKLARVLDEAASGILKEVADALRALVVSEWKSLALASQLKVVLARRALRIEKDRKPLHELNDNERKFVDLSPLDVYALRGGMYRETAWAKSPLQPTVVASTVDQVGSRLLFRGYGVSDSMKPVHAGLVGNDALVLLDEAHCAKPFEQTMRAVERYRAWGEPNPTPFTFVSVTATPTDAVPEEQIERDSDEDRSHALLGARINASKRAKLVVAEKAKGKTFKQWGKPLVDELEKQARALVSEGGCVGVIVNRVATARALRARLGADAVLLTGRMRPLDRDRVFAERLQPLLSGATGTPPKFVIGTQCLECGADFDFHALVTECASLDALRQRFGRLNRIAKRSNAEAAIVIRSDQTDDTSADPIYGASLGETWKWLSANATDGTFDFGVAAVRAKLEGVPREQLDALNSPAPSAPVLFPAHLDCWVQTHPIPKPDPDPALFLHGPKEAGQPDVQVVFRADLGDNIAQWSEIVSLCPPWSSEAVAVPIGVFKRWLAGEDVSADETGDVEGAAEEELTPDDETEPRPALWWCGPDESAVVRAADEVRPNQTYVVPCSAPGARALADFPADRPAIDDYAGEAFQRSRDKALLWLKDVTIPEDATPADEAAQVLDAIRALADSPKEWEARAAAWFLDSANAKRRDVAPHPLGGVVVTGTRRLMQFDPTHLDDSEPGESFRGRAVTLKEHSLGVAGRARAFAQACGLDASLYEQAGLWHDLGKLDPRFQAMLRQSSPRTAVREPLAKSAKQPRTREEADELRTVHRYPKGGRHELLSVAAVEAKCAAVGADDLLLHLIATHHGSARPFALPVEENDDATEFTPTLFTETFPRVSAKQDIAGWNAELPERFWRVVRKYGWWGAAYHEAVFRLADHAQSAAEQERDNPFPPPAEPKWVPFAGAPRRAWHELPLPGLDGANPLAFLAALGTLRVADRAFDGARLSWKLCGHWVPVLHLPRATEPADLVAALHKLCCRTPNEQAKEHAEALHRTYRKHKKAADKKADELKKRNLRGAERDSALKKEVAPLREQEATARATWLEALQRAVPAAHLALGKSISVSSNEFATYAQRIECRQHAPDEPDREASGFAAAYGSEACLSASGTVMPTELQLVNGSGHQFFLDTFSKLVEQVTREQIHRALFANWTYPDERLAFRWDPFDDRRYAASWSDPGDEAVRGEHGANLLAANALPLFPLMPTRWGAGTTAFHEIGDDLFFRWPLWESLHTIDGVRSLLQLGEFASKRVAVAEYGVCRAYQVRKFEVGKPPLSKLNFCPSVILT